MYLSFLNYFDYPTTTKFSLPLQAAEWAFIIVTAENAYDENRRFQS